MKAYIILCCLLIIIKTITAQRNYVPNPSFEELDKRPKKDGQIELAYPWFSATMAAADIYSKFAKSELIGVPTNAYGGQKPLNGSNYAGFLAFSYRNKEPRSYLEVKLLKTLKAGESYCISFNISLADLSRYAVNNIGAYLSTTPMSAANTNILKAEPQIMHKQNKIMNDQYWWEKICAVYEAKGGEQYLTIGNFSPDEETKYVKMKRPREFHKPQTYDAYYYVDMVEVIPLDSVKSCKCDKGIIKRAPSLVYQKNFSDIENLPVKEQLQKYEIYFAEKSSNIEGSAIKTAEKIYELLKNNPDIAIKIVGHSDYKESKELEGDISLIRAKMVNDFLVSKGISQDRLITEGVKDSQPVDTGTMELARAKNRRVNFIVLQLKIRE